MLLPARARSFQPPSALTRRKKNTDLTLFSGKLGTTSRYRVCVRYPGGGEVHHDLLERRRLLRLSLRVQRDLLAELSRVWRAGSGTRTAVIRSRCRSAWSRGGHDDDRTSNSHTDPKNRQTHTHWQRETDEPSRGTSETYTRARARTLDIPTEHTPTLKHN